MRILKCKDCGRETKTMSDHVKALSCGCGGVKKLLTAKEDEESSLSSVGLDWLAADEVTEAGWYWMRLRGETGIIKIRRYRQKMCNENWPIYEEAIYLGPLKEPV